MNYFNGWERHVCVWWQSTVASLNFSYVYVHTIPYVADDAPLLYARIADNAADPCGVVWLCRGGQAAA